ncbi:Peroxidase N1 [Linum grandiflorum]
MATSRLIVTLVLAIMFPLSVTVHGQGTRVGFYSTSCPRVETIVRTAVQSSVSSDPTVAPGLLRMHFHDCFVQGCDGSVLISGTGTERNAVPNLSLNGFSAINDAKTQLEATCPGVVSCADILALAARDAVVLTGGVSWPVPTGRRDGRISIEQEANDNLPGPMDTVDSQIQQFDDLGLNVQDLVTLTAGHTLGTASCATFRYRLYNYSNTGGPDPSIAAAFLPTLRSFCPENGDASRRVAMDTGSQNRFDTSYFTNIRNGRGVLESDQRLWTDARTSNFVRRYLGLSGLLGLTFNVEFGRSMVKMSNIGVKTGTNGEIRRVCSAIN